MSDRVPPLNMTSDERKALYHCIIAGEDNVVEHFGEQELERINSIKEKLGFTVHE